MKSTKFLLAGAMLLASSPGHAQQLADTSIQIEPIQVSTWAGRSSIAPKVAPAPIRSLDALPQFLPIERADLQGLNAAIELRGFSPSALGYQRYTWLLRDGMPVGTRHAATLLFSDREPVVVISGPFSSHYGSGAMGGVINILTTPSQGAIAGRVALEYGSWSSLTAAASVGGSIAQRLDFDLKIDHQRRENDYRTGSHNLLKTSHYEKLVYGPAYDTTYHRSTFDKTQATLRLGWDVAERWRLNLYNELYFTDRAPTNGTLWGIYDRIDHAVTRHFHRLDLTGKAGRHEIRVSPFTSREASKFADRGDWGNYRRTSDYNTYGITAQDVIRFERGYLMAGIDNLSERISETKALEDGTPQAPNNPKYLTSATGLFAEMEWRLGDLSAKAGARYDNTLFRTFRTPHMTINPGRKTYASFSPNFALRYYLEDIRLSLHASVGRAFLAPEAFRLVADYQDAWGYTYKGNPDLKPETATTWEFGASYASRVLHLGAALFMTDHRNLTITDPAQAIDNITYYINAQRAHINGVELNASLSLNRLLELGSGWEWSLQAYYQRIYRSRIETGRIEAERLGVSRTKANLATQLRYRRMDLRLSGRYVSSHKEQNFLGYPPQLRPALASEPYIRTPDFVTFDAALGWQATEKLALRLAATNLLDELYMERDGYYLPGRSFSIGATLNF